MTSLNHLLFFWKDSHESHYTNNNQEKTKKMIPHASPDVELLSSTKECSFAGNLADFYHNSEILSDSLLGAMW